VAQDVLSLRLPSLIPGVTRPQTQPGNVGLEQR
jgi:hypothetical protein